MFYIHNTTKEQTAPNPDTVHKARDPKKGRKEGEKSRKIEEPKNPRIPTTAKELELYLVAN